MPLNAMDRMSPNNSVLLEKRNEFGQKQFLLAPIEPNTNTIHFHDDNDSLKVPINITSIDTIDDVVGGRKIYMHGAIKLNDLKINKKKYGLYFVLFSAVVWKVIVRHTKFIVRGD